MSAQQTDVQIVTVTWQPPAETNGILEKYQAKCCEVRNAYSCYTADSESDASTSVTIKEIKTTKSIECLVLATVKKVEGMPYEPLRTESNKTEPITMSQVYRECPFAVAMGV